ncbi:MAG: DUF2911 domain-containing protein [Bacteroidia bacterium]|nr:DUF2911 domain-containing protein [Bacteroidia bacterium]
MLRFLLILPLALLISIPAALGQKFPGLDKSPADIVYLRKGNKPIVKVVYSRPAKSDRQIFGDLVPYGKVWRTGANEATEIKFYQDVVFGDKPVKAGTYVLFSIPGETSWTLILNSELDQWGSYGYKDKYDVARTEIVPAKVSDPIEYFSIAFRDEAGGGVMMLGWDMVLAEVPIKW